MDWECGGWNGVVVGGLRVDWGRGVWSVDWGCGGWIEVMVCGLALGFV